MNSIEIIYGKTDGNQAYVNQLKDRGYVINELPYDLFLLVEVMWYHDYVFYIPQMGEVSPEVARKFENMNVEYIKR